MTERRRWIGLIVFILLCLGAGGLGSLATTPELNDWYKTVERPDWNPPSWVFGPVWTTLYILMGIAAWLVWKPAGFKDRGAGIALSLFAIQLVLNVAWSWLFFRMHEIGWAAVEIVVLWLALLATTIAFFRRSQLAGWLLIPYLGWVTFASFLTFTIWRMNAA